MLRLLRTAVCARRWSSRIAPATLVGDCDSGVCGGVSLLSAGSPSRRLATSSPGSPSRRLAAAWVLTSGGPGSRTPVMYSIWVRVTAAVLAVLASTMIRWSRIAQQSSESSGTVEPKTTLLAALYIRTGF